jgi:hypothetical protein
VTVREQVEARGEHDVEEVARAEGVVHAYGASTSRADSRVTWQYLPYFGGLKILPVPKS